MRTRMIPMVLALVAGAGASCEGGGTTGPFGYDAGPAVDAFAPRPDGSTTPPVGDCADLSCVPCGKGRACAAETPHLAGTCCAMGDSLLRLGRGGGSEVVHVESDGTHTVTCGGFGAVIENVTDPTSPRTIGHAGDRCQHSALGPMIGADRILYLTHHGDSWVPSPSLSTYRITAAGSVAGLDTIADPDILFEGLDFDDGHLYVAAHLGGLRVYSIDRTGRPVLLSTLGGLGNATQVEVSGDLAYVTSRDRGVQVVSVADPAAPALLATLATTGPPRSVAIDAGRLFVALGGLGLDVFDASDPEDPVFITNVETLGSPQAVATGDGVFAVAAWSHVAIYDAESLALLTTEKTRPRTEFEQDLGIAMVGDVVYAGEWEGLHTFRYRPGHVAPELWLDEDLFTFAPDRTDAAAVVVSNVGALPLSVTDLEVDVAGFTLDRTAFDVVPGGAAFFEITSAGGASGTLAITSNDVDEMIAQIHVAAADNGRLDIGDRLTDAFGFLDPTGAGQVTGLEGHVVVLAYFALF